VLSLLAAFTSTVLACTSVTASMCTVLASWRSWLISTSSMTPVPDLTPRFIAEMPLHSLPSTAHSWAKASRVRFAAESLYLQWGIEGFLSGLGVVLLGIAGQQLHRQQSAGEGKVSATVLWLATHSCCAGTCF
jgi:hypothetical protein